jgi:hypothetical protein
MTYSQTSHLRMYASFLTRGIPSELQLLPNHVKVFLFIFIMAPVARIFSSSTPLSYAAHRQVGILYKAIGLVRHNEQHIRQKMIFRNVDYWPNVPPSGTYDHHKKAWNVEYWTKYRRLHVNSFNKQHEKLVELTVIITLYYVQRKIQKNYGAQSFF